MGQRLVLSIYKDDVKLANAYYHWSGYTGSTVYLIDQILTKPDTQALMNKIKASVDKKQNVLGAIRLLELTEARLTAEDEAAMNQFAPNEFFEIANDRNDGLIQFTEGQMEAADDWAEATASIDVTKEIVTFDAFFVDDRSVVINEYEYEEEELDELQKHKEIPYEMSFKEFEDVRDIVFGVLDARHDMYQTPDGSIVSFIA